MAQALYRAILAARNLGLKSIGVELKEAYFTVAENNMKQAEEERKEQRLF